MDRLRRFKRGSSEAARTKDGTKTSNETVPETGRSVTDGGLDLETKGRTGIARTLTAIGDRLGISTGSDFDDSGFKRVKRPNSYYPMTPPRLYRSPRLRFIKTLIPEQSELGFD
jgi:hypothetical protein